MDEDWIATQLYEGRVNESRGRERFRDSWLDEVDEILKNRWEILLTKIKV